MNKRKFVLQALLTRIRLINKEMCDLYAYAHYFGLILSLIKD